MTNPLKAATGCLLVGEYVDEAECPTNPAAHRSEAVRPNVVANYIDLWGHDDGWREFSVLLKDGRIVVVQGHGLKHEPHPLAGEDVFSIVVRTRTEEVVVALFKSDEVAGIFHGDFHPDRKIA